ncbi:hypothetical protein HDC92_002506 [Pedobacter sp. AK017]|uniref:DUF6266 family protein n=1 Tax=Pedobacter sp. AK017 TaxID=2723073 RepID=UPI0016119691|nr:DUF6266 family protein [Pedobacter sp. AK017]MBB5438825.1 hypothetical protein [Pedobacter sp. AK017]
MGFLTGGIDYDMIGRVGNHVGRKRKGRNVLAMRPSKSNKPPTQAQLDQRLKFGLMTSFISRIASVVDVGFAAYDAKMTARNAAVGYNMEHAITGVSPNYSINYEKLLYSKGKLEMPEYPEIATVAAARLDYSWPALTGITYAKGTDKATFLVYNEVKDKFVVLRGGALRSALSYNLLLPGNFSGDSVQCYISFVSADGKLVSKNYYVGEHIVV